MAKNETNEKDVPRKRTGVKFLLQFIILVFFAAFFGAVTFSNLNIYNGFKAQISGIRAEIDRAEERKKSLTKDQSYYSSDEFVEKIAREQLGLIRKDEIIFIQSN